MIKIAAYNKYEIHEYFQVLTLANKTIFSYNVHTIRWTKVSRAASCPCG